jgi:hypothetical protein
MSVAKTPLIAALPPNCVEMFTPRAPKTGKYVSKALIYVAISLIYVAMS